MRGFLRGRRGIILVAVTVALLAVLTVWWGRRDRLPSNAAFVYRSDVVNKNEITDQARLQEALYGIEPSGSGTHHLADTAKEYALRLVLDDAARRRGISASDSDVDAAEKAFLAKAYPQGRSSFIDALAAEGLSEQQVRDEIRHQLVVEGLYKQITSGITVTPEQVSEAYVARPADFTSPGSRRLAEIVVSDRQQADRVLSLLRAGHAFADVARSFSLDQSTAAKGGDLGWVTQSQLQGPFGKAAFASRQGGVFGPVAAATGQYLYVGQVTGVRASRQLTLAEVRGTLHDTLLARSCLQTWQDFVQQQLRDAHIRYARGYRPADPGTATTEGPGPVSPTQSATSGASR